MISTREYFKSTIGRKTLVGFTGLAISLFALVHMLENLLLLAGPEAYNRYTSTLANNHLLVYPAEVGLVLVFSIHMLVAFQLFFSGRISKPSGRYFEQGSEKGSSFAARTMILSGSLLLVFLVLHLITFKWGAYYSVTYDGVEMRDLYRLVMEKLSEPLYAGWYVLSLVVLMLHLSHGFKSAFQSLGIMSSLNPRLRKIGWGFAIVVTGGYLIHPLVFFFTGGGTP